MAIKPRDKLLIEYPFNQGLTIYLGILKDISLVVAKGAAAIALLTALVYAIGAVGVSVVIGAVGSFIAAIIALFLAHPLFGSLVLIIAAVMAIASVKKSNR